jgi:hypothetical protein
MLLFVFVRRHGFNVMDYYICAKIFSKTERPTVAASIN